jgi:hypothetical protein
MSVLYNLESHVEAILRPVYVDGHMIPRTLRSIAEVKLYVAEIM